MSSFSTFLILAMVVLLGLAGYYYLDEILPVKAELQELQQQNHELLFHVKQLEERNKEIAKRLEKRTEALSSEKEHEISKLKTTYEQLIGELNEQVQKGEITITRLADQLKVNIVDRIIFPSGKADLSERGTKVLEQVGVILKQSSQKYIKVEGHTDNVPIHKKLQDRFPSNWELSVARATNVVRFLNEKVGIKAKRLEASGFADSRPLST
ncbi:MAG: OmpA family protein, partial [bacterium]